MISSIMRNSCIAFLLAFAAVTTSHAFSTTTHSSVGGIKIPYYRTATSMPSVLFAGFGNSNTSGSNNNNSKKKGNKKTASASASTSTPLKPKSQWDRFMALKQCTAVKVGVRVVTTDSSSSTTTTSTTTSWLDVGRVRAVNDTLQGQITALVVQRGLIAEHAKRLYPLQISTKDKVEWGYQLVAKSDDGNTDKNDDDNDNDNDNEWIAVNVKDPIYADESVNAKNIGFEGRPDPASGYYCHYDFSSKGRKVLNLESDKGEPNSKGARAL